ncbi:MAG: hypothetical protein ACOX8G_07830 [Eubacterium sp.]
MLKKLFKILLIVCILIGIVYVAYIYFTKDDEFDEFEDDFGCDEDQGKASCFSKIKAGIRSVLPF